MHRSTRLPLTAAAFLVSAIATAAAQGDTLSTQAIGATVSNIRFYERGAGETGYPYGETFRRDRARYIGIMLDFTMPAARPALVGFTCLRTMPSGARWTGERAFFRTEQGWTRVTWTPGARGWEQPGNWEVGTHRVECFSGGQPIASGSYRIVPDGEPVVWLPDPAMANRTAEQLFADFQALYREKRYAESLKPLHRAGSLGLGKAQDWLSYMYRSGLGVPTDYEEALRWGAQAAEHGERNAISRVGIAYDRGQGVRQDASAAAEWYRRAAELGDPFALHRLGEMYENGTGVAQDLAQAKQLYERAATAGNEASKTALERVAKAMSGQNLGAVAGGASPGAAANPASGAATGAASCKGSRYRDNGLDVWLDKANRVTRLLGHDITGRYRYESHPSGQPRIDLNPDGTGIFELWPAASGGGPGGREQPIRWWVLTNCEGSAWEQVKAARGNGYVLYFEHPDGRTDVAQLQVTHDGLMVILGERVKRK